MTQSGATPYKAPDLSLSFDDHVRQYKATGGAIGHEWNGVHTLILTTTGRRSGQQRDHALIYTEVDGDYIVIASKGGSPAHPGWYLNLEAEPTVAVQVLADRFAARAETVTGPERVRLWAKAAEVWPNYNVYTTRTDREIPVVRLRRVGDA